jgi:lysophospholipase L1-like esterase
VFPRSLLVDRRFPVSLSCESATERGVILDNSGGAVQHYHLETLVDDGKARLNFGEIGFRFYPIGSEPASDLNVICLGDSTTEGTGANVGGSYKDWPNELSWQITGTGDRALSGDTYFTSWGLTKVHFRGTVGLNAVRHEGRGGWSAEDYLTLANKSGRDNAFWNPAANGGAGDFDFDFYLTDNGFNVGSIATGVDATGSNCVVFVQLGWNDLSNKSPDAAAADTGTIIDKILAARSGTRIVVLGFSTPPVNVPIRRQNLPAEGRIITPETVFRTAVLAHRDAYKDMVNTKGSNVQFYDLAPTFDGDTGYTIDTNYWKVVPWSTEDQFTASRDYVHPNEKGNMMWARAIKALMARDFL